jgi:hypothetical protein
MAYTYMQKNLKLSYVGLSVSQIEKLAKKIMMLDMKIWSRYRWSAGDEVKWDIYKPELKKGLAKMKITYLPPLFYHIFEDANYHTLNGALADLKVLREPGQGPKRREAFNDYVNRGGRTWNL